VWSYAMCARARMDAMGEGDARGSDGCDARWRFWTASDRARAGRGFALDDAWCFGRVRGD
jgi:hypothetical protein